MGTVIAALQYSSSTRWRHRPKDDNEDEDEDENDSVHANPLPNRPAHR